MQTVCGPGCAVEYAREKREKAEAAKLRVDRKETRRKLDEMQGIPELLKKAQHAFNAYIRARDAGRPCISCGRPLSAGAVGGGYDCGHYRSVGSAGHLRFDEQNAHGQCKYCNQHLAGNHVMYRIGLIERIGIDAVERIESDNRVSKWGRDELREFAEKYRARSKQVL